MSDGRLSREDGKLAALARTTSGEQRRGRHARAPEVTFGTVRRLDSGPRPDRHPSVRWPDDRRPHPQRVENASTPVSEALRRRFHGSPGEPSESVDDDDFAREIAGSEAGSEWVPGRGVAVVEDDASGRGPREGAPMCPRRDGVEANSRLTGSTAAVLLVLLAIEGFTLLAIRPLLNVHVFVGMLLIPPVLLKVGSTSWRFAKYYLGDPAYREKGPPMPLLRLLGPFVVVLTAIVLASGIALLVVSPAWRTKLLLLHKASFVLWFIAMAVHVLGHLLDTAKLAPRDWYWRTRRQIAGASLRQWLVVSAVVIGVVIGAATLPAAGSWLSGVHHTVSGAGHR